MVSLKLFDNKIQIEKDLNKLLNGMEIERDKPDGLYSLYTNHYIGIGKIKDKKLKSIDNSLDWFWKEL